MSPLAPFEELGRAVAAAWGAVDHRTDRFPAIAAEALAAAALGDIDAAGLIRRIAAAQLPPQKTLDQAFGQPPVTLFSHPRFYVEALFWHVGTTGIHQHGFAGAFRVLDGSSLHCRYRFTPERVPERRIDARLRLGEVRLTDVELLERGAVRTIEPGPALIHSTFHLDTPSVTVVVRTPYDQSIEYEYRPPHVAIDPAFRDPATTKRLQLLSLLQRLESPDYESVAATALAALDLHGAFLLLGRAHLHLGARPAFARLAARARQLHGDLIDRLLPTIAEQSRRALLIDLRRPITHLEHRFFLALLMNLPGRRPILEAVRARYADPSPVERVVRWIGELGGGSALGLEMTPLLLRVVESLLRGEAQQTILARGIGPDDDTRARSERLLAQLHAQLGSHPVLGPLFTIADEATETTA